MSFGAAMRKRKIAYMHMHMHTGDLWITAV